MEHQGPKIIQNINGKKIKKIYHSADIHIRVIKRHQEYKSVFDNLFETLRKTVSGNNSEKIKSENVFVICGDLFHSRDKFAAETLGVFDYLIKGLSAIMDVIIIAGNHDTHVNNSRMDIVSGIVGIKDYPGVFYLKNSGYYAYNDVLFGVSSLVDNKFSSFCEIKDVSKNFNISVALYHGGTRGAITDSGMMCNNGISTKMFDGYDLVMLGDYHKRQYLNSQKTIAYPGSLIQQNFGEEMEKGILEWDTLTKNSKFINVKNDYAFINLHDTEIDNLKNFEFPKFCRIRLIRSVVKGSTEKTMEQKIRKKLAKKTEILSLVSSWKGSNNHCNLLLETEEALPEENEGQKINITTLKKTFEELISGKYKGEYLQKVEKINEEILTNVFYTEQSETSEEVSPCRDYSQFFSKNKMWKLKCMTFKNIYIYGGDKENTVNFEDNKGVTGILAENASGKTSLINIILYSILGSITKSKSIINRNIVNKYAKKYFVSLEIIFEDSENSLVINREGRVRARKGKQSSMDETLKIFMKKKIPGSEDHILEEISTNEKIKTQCKINEILGISREEMLSSLIINNTNSKSSIFMQGADLYNFLCELFELNIFDKISESINKKIKETNSKINDYSSRITGYNQMILINDNLSDPSEDYRTSQIEEELPIFTEDEKLILNEIVYSNTEVFCKGEKLYFDLESVKKYIIKERELLEKLQKFSDGKKKCISQEDFTKCIYQSQNEPFDLGYFNRKINSIEEKIIEVTDEKNFLEKDLSCFLESGVHHCVSTEEIKMAEKTIELYENTLNFIRNSTDDLIERKLALFVVENIEHYKKSKELVKNIENLKKIRCISENIENMKREACEKITETLVMLKESKEFVVKKLRESIFIKEAKIDKINKQKSSKKITNEVKKLKQESETEISKQMSDLEILKELKNMYCSSCIPKIFLEKGVNILQKKVNRILSPISGLFMKINTEIDSKWEIFFEKNNGEISIGAEHASGFQRLVAEISMKSSILDIKDNICHKHPLFIVDETADCISEGNLETIDDLFYILRSKFHNVLFVSHNDYLKTKVDHNIVISTDYTNSSLI